MANGLGRLKITIHKSFLITVFTVLIPILFQLIYIRFVSYSVDKEIYGNFVLLQTLIAGLSTIFLRIPSDAYYRFFNEAKDKISYVNEFRTILIFVNLFSIFVICLYGYIMQKFSFTILFILFIYFMLLNNYSFNQKIFLYNLERKKYFYINLFEAAAKFIFPIIFYIFYPTLLSFLLGLVIGYILSFLSMMKYMKDYPFKVNINIKNYKKYFLYAYPTIFISISSWGISFSDRYFIEYLSSTKDVAIYAVLAQVAAIGQIVGQIYSMYATPIVLKKYEEDNTDGIKYLNSALKKLFLVFTLLAIIIYFLPYQIYTILLDEYLIAQNYYFWTFYILVIGIFLAVFQSALSMYLSLYKKLHILAYIYAIAFFINIIGNMFINKYGIMAASISTLFAYLTINVGIIVYILNLGENNEST